MTTKNEYTTLAELALRTLDAQQAYFRSRTFADLGTSKKLEQQLREMATLALAEASQPSLFQGDDNE
jgi:hypothetical protein